VHEQTTPRFYPKNIDSRKEMAKTIRNNAHWTMLPDCWKNLAISPKSPGFLKTREQVGETPKHNLRNAT